MRVKLRRQWNNEPEWNGLERSFGHRPCLIDVRDMQMVRHVL